MNGCSPLWPSNLQPWEDGPSVVMGQIRTSESLLKRGSTQDLPMFGHYPHTLPFTDTATIVPRLNADTAGGGFGPCVLNGGRGIVHYIH